MKLNGIWQCEITDHGAHHHLLEGTVPGCVHTDLQKAGIIGDFYYRTNADDVQWIENCDVTYSRNFTVETPEPNTYLHFDGLDVYAEIFLNGVSLGKADNMFHEWDFPVDGILKAGENQVTVCFSSPVKMVEGLPKRPGAFTTERLYTRRIQCTYGWDWVARFVTMGIYRDVSLHTRYADRLEDVYVYTDSINAYAAQICVNANFAYLTGDAYANFTITAPDGTVVFQKERRLLLPRLTERIDIPEPALWFPTGYGDQPLYKLTVDAPHVHKEITFGIRTVTILELEDAPNSPEARKSQELKTHPHLVEWDQNEGSSCFILLVNGIKIFCKGANWVPCEPFPSAETPEKIEKLVKAARFGNVNMIRVWGGGVFEQDAFYEACDRHGLLVTQDFLMACGHYPEEDDAFIEKLKRETASAALRLRNHPCLVWWSGDNENAVRGHENAPDYWGRRAALEGMAPILDELDPQRRFLPSSPYGGVPYASGVRGTSHNTQYLGNFFQYIREGDFTHYQDHFETYLARFVAEQPALGMPFVSCLKKFMTDEDIFGEDTAVSEYHTKNNPAFKGITLYGYADIMARGIFGDFKDGADRTLKMQMLQCDWVRISLELFRRNQWYSSGIIYWMLNDCWPAANGWSILDYYTQPKPAFYAFKRAAAPVMGSVFKEPGHYTISVCNNTLDSTAVEGRVYTYNIVTGEEGFSRSFHVTAPANGAQVVLELPAEETMLDTRTVLLLDLQAGTHFDRAFFLPAHYAQMDFCFGQPRILEDLADSVVVTCDETQPFAMIDLPDLLEENCFFLKKGEVRKIPKVKLP